MNDVDPTNEPTPGLPSDDVVPAASTGGPQSEPAGWVGQPTGTPVDDAPLTPPPPPAPPTMPVAPVPTTGVAAEPANTPRWRHPAILAGAGIVAGFAAGLGGAVLLDQVTDPGGDDRTVQTGNPALDDDGASRSGRTDDAFGGGWGAQQRGPSDQDGRGFGTDFGPSQGQGQSQGQGTAPGSMGRPMPGNGSGAAPSAGQSGGAASVGGPGMGRSAAS